MYRFTSIPLMTVRAIQPAASHLNVAEVLIELNDSAAGHLFLPLRLTAMG